MRCLAALPLCVFACAASAQEHASQGDAAAMMRQAAANQLGILEYCQAQGHADTAAVAAEREAFAHAPASPAPTDGAEALGRAGTLAGPGGRHMTLAQLAATNGASVSDLCRQLAASAVQAAAFFKAQPKR